MSKINIVSFSAMSRPGTTQEEVLVYLENKLKELIPLKTDLVVFPEEVLISGEDTKNPNWEKNNAAALELTQRYAALLHTNICIGLEEPSKVYPGRRYNTSYAIDRSGSVIGKYRKRHITFRGLGIGCTPGSRAVTVDTDIGRIGIAICFDIGWRDHFRELKEAGAELIVWQAAYHGGQLMNAYAAVYSVPVVTSVWNNDSRIISAFGNTVASSSMWDPCVRAEIDPKAEIFHFDHNERRLSELRAEYGDRISFETEPNGNMFSVSVIDPTLTVEEIKSRYGMETYDEYHLKSTRDNEAVLEEYPELDV